MLDDARVRRSHGRASSPGAPAAPALRRSTVERAPVPVRVSLGHRQVSAPGKLAAGAHGVRGPAACAAGRRRGGQGRAGAAARRAGYRQVAAGRAGGERRGGERSASGLGARLGGGRSSGVLALDTDLPQPGPAGGSVCACRLGCRGGRRRGALCAIRSRGPHPARAGRVAGDPHRRLSRRAARRAVRACGRAQHCRRAGLPRPGRRGRAPHGRFRRVSR